MSFFNILSRSSSPISSAAATSTSPSSVGAPAATKVAERSQDSIAVGSLGEHRDMSTLAATKVPAKAAPAVVPPPPPGTPAHPAANPHHWPTDPHRFVARIWALVNEEPSLSEHTSSVIES